MTTQDGSRRWLITAVSSGIGGALAKAALARGDSVVGTLRDPAAVAAFEALAPGRATALVADLSDTAQAEAMVAKAIAQGPIDVLVNNAGQSIFGAFEETTVAEARAVFDINVFGPWAVTRAILPHFRERGSGTVVQISSGCGINGNPGLAAYSASKFALEGMTEALAVEISAFGLRAMLVEPGAIATRFISHGTREAGQRLPAYSFLSGQGKDVLNGYYETAASPPESVADAIVAALDKEALPLRLLIGDDMREPVRQKAAAFTALAEG